MGFPQVLKTPHSPSSSLLSPSLGHLPTKPAATTATAGPLAPGLCGDRKQPPRAGGSKGNKKAPIPLCLSCLYMGVTYLVAGGVSLPPLPVWVCCLLRVGAVGGNTCCSGLGAQGSHHRPLGEEVAVWHLLCSHPFPYSVLLVGKRFEMCQVMDSAQVAMTVRGRAWPELTVFSRAWPSLQPRQCRWQQPGLGATAM